MQHFGGKNVMYLCGDYCMYCTIAFSLFVPLFEVMQPIFKCSSLLLHVSSFLSVLLLLLIHTINLQATYLQAIWQFSTSHHLVVVDMWQIIMASFISGYLIRLLFYALWWLMVIDGVNCNTWLLNQSPPVTSKINTLVRTPLTGNRQSRCYILCYGLDHVTSLISTMCP